MAVRRKTCVACIGAWTILFTMCRAAQQPERPKQLAPTAAASDMARN
jgi:hypothetical protein